MPSHKFKVGDIVVINPAISRFVPSGVFEVTKRLPGNGEREYRIKSANEPHERVARESELIKALETLAGSARPGITSISRGVHSRLRVFIHLDAPVAIRFQEMCAVRTFDSRNPLGRWASRQGLILPFEHKWLARV
jgi:hypothetical protein